jgi:catechol 2,3-dioxygenase-like lactoylglutathione lyase family enzyme
MAPIARFSVVAIDCPDAPALAAFYSAITGWPARRTYPEDDWVELDPPDGRAAAIAFQQVADYRPPQWPGAEHPQQLHLDFDVPDLDAAEAQVLAAGARKHEVQPGRTFRVYLDPVGHPFCLVLEPQDRT